MTDQLIQQTLLLDTLRAIFSLSRETLPVDATSIARVVGTSPMRVAEALVALEQRGWVDASRARLTMLGLAKAVADGIPKTRVTAGPVAQRQQQTNASRRRGGSTPARRVPTPRVIPSELPIAARSRVQH
jgi:hypothetical protein